MKRSVIAVVLVLTTLAVPTIARPKRHKPRHQVRE